MDTGLTGMSVLITGASGGIGFALAQAFAGEGAQLVLHAHRGRERLEALVRDEGWGERALIGCADLREPGAIDPLCAAAVARFGRLDLVIANAGVWPTQERRLHEIAPERLRELIDLNLLGAIDSCRSFMSQLAASGPRPDGRGASVCLIGSTAGRFGEAGHLDYAVTKAGLYGLMRSLKNELVTLDPWARINMVEPGWTVTPMAEAALEVEGTIEAVCATMPLRQLARPEDIARAVVFLSSPAMARHVSGEVITVAGGMEGRSLWAPEQVDPRAARARLRPDNSEG